LSTAAIEKLIWLLIFGGLLLASLGLFVRRADTDLGMVFLLGGAALAFAGAVLIWVRSKMDDPE
jgi:hypothetical protein